MRVIIAGHRDFYDARTVCDAVVESGFKITEVVSGGCRGVDALGERFSREVLKKEPIVYPADWKKYGKAAGPIRNQQMAENADALIALLIEGSRGTKNMIETAKKKGLPVYVKRI